MSSIVPPSRLGGDREGGGVQGRDRLYRFGLEAESAEQLARDAADAERRDFPHGISAFSRSSRLDAASAPRRDIEQRFRVHRTGRNPYHYTIELPKPVTEAVAGRINRLFGRAG
jgi:hypothetical protein